MYASRKSFLGPIALILVGIALLLNQFGLWSLAWVDLLRLWPLILILIGLDIVLGNTRTGGVVLLLTGIAIIVLAVALIDPSTSKRAARDSVTYEYPVKGVESVTVRLEVGTAGLDVRSLSDSSNLLEAGIDYDGRRTRVDYTADTNDAQASILLKSESRAVWLPFFKPFSEDWRVRLSREVPLALQVTAGVSNANLDLQGLRLTELQLNAGVGDVHVALPDQGSYQVVAHGGVGSLTIDVPPGVEARIRLDGGLGSANIAQRFERQERYYVSEGYASAQNRVDIHIDGGVGSVTIR